MMTQQPRWPIRLGGTQWLIISLSLCLMALLGLWALRRSVVLRVRLRVSLPAVCASQVRIQGRPDFVART